MLYRLVHNTVTQFGKEVWFSSREKWQSLFYIKIDQSPRIRYNFGEGGYCGKGRSYLKILKGAKICSIIGEKRMAAAGAKIFRFVSENMPQKPKIDKN